MTPKAIVRTAVERGLDMIAISDHNSARNVTASIRAARNTDLIVIPGIEINSSEEVHILGLFERDEDAKAVQEEVYARLFGENDEEVFGYQVVVDEEDLVEDLDKRLLIGATTLPAEMVAAAIHNHGGLAVGSHIDREGFGIFSQLGFIPETLELDALEISKRTDRSQARAKYPQAKGYTLIRSSDAHFLEDIGSVFTLAEMAEPSFRELKMALAGIEGRRIVEDCEL